MCLRSQLQLVLWLLPVVLAVETVQYSRRAKHPHDIHVLTSVLTEANIAIIQCFIKGHTLLTWEEEREFCCSAIMTSSVHVIDRKRVSKLCREQSTPVPDLASLASMPLPQQQPKLVFIEGHEIHRIPDLTNSVWSYFVWDDIILLGLWLASHDALQKTAFLQRLPLDPDTQFRARMTSSIDRTGGMHRSMKHTIQLELPSYLSTINHQGPHQSSLWIRWILPNDAFVSPTDAFDANARWNLTLHTVPGRIIDEEQSALTSDPHVVYIHLQGRVTSLAELSAIEFATKLHFRYPPPSGDPTKTHHIVSFLAPELVAGEVTLSMESTDGNKVLLLQPPGHEKAEVTETTSPILYAQVPTPQQSDRTFVLATTLLVSLVGAWVVWKTAKQAIHV